MLLLILCRVRLHLGVFTWPSEHERQAAAPALAAAGCSLVMDGCMNDRRALTDGQGARSRAWREMELEIEMEMEKEKVLLFLAIKKYYQHRSIERFLRPTCTC